MKELLLKKMSSQRWRSAGLGDLNLIKKLRDPEQRRLRMTDTWSVGFTLMELLVVLLIISLLVAIAVPSYTHIIWKSKAQNLEILTRKVAQAHQTYYEDNYEMAPSFDAIDIDVDAALPTPTNSGVAFLDGGLGFVGGRQNENFKIVFSQCDIYRGCWTLGVFIKGPYVNSGFGFLHDPKYASTLAPYKRQLVCFSYKTNDFCKKFLGISKEPDYTSGLSNFYTM